MNDDPNSQSAVAQTWVQLALEGDPEAFARLYDLYVDRLYRFVFFRVGDTQAAEDITSQVFLKAWEKLDSYEERGLPFSAWLFRIARNLVIDHYRARREVLPLDAPEAAHAAANSEADERVAEKIELERLLKLLQHLTDDQRQVLTMKFIDGLGTDEIAHMLGKREGAVRALQMRGLKALAALLEKQDE